MNLGSVKIAGSVVLAPIAGYTDSPYRRIARAYGAGFTVTELVSSEGIVRNNKKTVELLRFTEDERPIGIQIFGKNPSVMADAAAIVAQLSPDFIDINMGCPAKKVCADGKGSGAALLRNPTLVQDITAAVTGASGIPVSAKIRLGWDAGSVNYKEVISALETGGVSFITVHGRTRAQGYGGSADWDKISSAAESAVVPVVGNGDIKSFGEAKARLANSGCAAVMIGRAACANPWIFANQEPTPAQRIEMIKRHFEMNMDFYGEWGLVLMRKHTVRYIQGLPFAASLRRELSVAASKSEVFALLDNLLARQEEL